METDDFIDVIGLRYSIRRADNVVEGRGRGMSGEQPRQVPDHDSITVCVEPTYH
jgi:hypothetical protein